MQLSETALKELEKLLGDRLLIGDDVVSYAYDASSVFALPQAVALPETKEEVIEILKLADFYEFAVTPRGAGTSTTGGPVALTGGLVVSFARMNRILELNLEERVVLVEPGVLNGDLKNYLKKFGLFYPPDPASYAFSTIGGNVATGAGGPRGLKYGTTKDYVLSLLVGLPGGHTLRTGPATLKAVVPYNLTQLFVGSEGTLGLFLEIHLKVIPFPESRALFLIQFTREENALLFINEVIQRGLTPATAEFIDRTTLSALKSKFEELIGSHEALLLMEFDGSYEEVEKDIDKVSLILRAYEYSFLISKEEEEMERLWEIRRNVSPSLKTFAPKKVSDDIVVPRRMMIEFLRFIRGLEEESRIRISAYGHAGDGNFHVNLLFEEGWEEEAKRVREKILKKVIEIMGTISGEHGVGYTKRSYVVWELDPIQLDIMAKIKAIFDPKGILNPLKKIPET